MLPLLVQVIIALVIAGFIVWAARQLIALVPMEAIYAKAINVVITIVAVAIVIFYVIIPLLDMLAGVHIGVTTVK
jgi:hypothetical protein